MSQGRPAPLLHAIAIRLAAIGFGLVILTVAVTVFWYAGNIERLRRATLEDQAEEVFDALRSGKVSRFEKLCARYPDSYGYRMFDESNEVQKQLNGQLFPLLPRYRSGRPDLSFKHWQTPNPWDDQWFITVDGDVGGKRLWINLTMIGDPANLWGAVLVETTFEHVFAPLAIVAPLLSIAIFLALRSALQPLSRIAERARGLAIEADHHSSLQPLSSNGLPREAQSLVGAINVLLEKYESIAEQQKQFAANAAHELRTPLAVLMLQISELPRGAAVDRLKADLGVLTRLVDQLLRFAQAGELVKTEFRRCDLREIARAACEEMAVPAALQGLSMELDEVSDPVKVMCSPEFIQIAIRNIIENSLHAAPPGSTVSVRVDPQGSVTVLDRGPGISDAEKELIYQRFWTRKAGKGTGIGLALVRRIMDIHAGTVRVEDRDGGGACVVLSVGGAAMGSDRQLRQPGSFLGSGNSQILRPEDRPAAKLADVE